MTEVLVAAFALMLVLEGIMPFIAPKFWRVAFRKFTEMSDGQIRFAGLTSMIIGVLILVLAT